MRVAAMSWVVALAGCAVGPVSGGGSGSETGSDVTTTLDSETDGGTDTSSPETCGGFLVASEYIPPNVMFVVDLSSSMLETWDDDDDPLTPPVTHWQTTRSMLEQLVPAIDVYDLGLQRYPSADACPDGCSDADVCLVDTTAQIETGGLHGDMILAALPNFSASALEIHGGSPAAGAYVAARDHLLTLPSNEQRAIVLVSDGRANCAVEGLPGAVEQFDASLEALVQETLAVHAIQTIVVGVGAAVGGEPSSPAQPDTPGVDAFAALNNLALAGGWAFNGGADPRKFFDAGEPAELIFALEPTLSPGIDCTLDLNYTAEGPPDPEQIPLVSLEIDGMEIPLVLDCASEHGWAWIIEGEILSLCGSYCEAVKAGASVEGIYGCPDLPLEDPSARI